jgi:hypothetical protein
MGERYIEEAGGSANPQRGEVSSLPRDPNQKLLHHLLCSPSYLYLDLDLQLQHNTN